MSGSKDAGPDGRSAIAPGALLSLERVEALLSAALHEHVVVVGDVMLDEFVTGAVDRICPEAPVQVLSVQETSFFLGGAGNVANNLAPYIGRVSLVGVTGEDEGRERLMTLLRDIGCESSGLVAVANRPTTCKTRFVSHGTQLLRCDREEKRPLEEEDQRALIQAIRDTVESATLVVAVDYAKGVLEPAIFTELARICREKGVPLLVDPKRRDFSVYRGATLIKPNQKETEESTGIPIDSLENGEQAARTLLEATGAEAVLITLGHRGMMLCERGRDAVALPTESREVFDVTGAGDTTMAFVALGRSAGLTYAESAALANTAAGVAVAKRGTARVEPFELLKAFAAREATRRPTPKRLDRADVAALGDSLRRGDKSIVFTNGCFDLFHAGHIELLRQARALGDVLVVGLNSDSSVKRVKGNNRPFLGLDDRAAILSAFEFVDHVVVFEEDDPLSIIGELRPNILVKGGNYTPNEVIGADLVTSHGGRVEIISLASDRSITELSREIHRKLSTAKQR